jgi:hypothetical protein
MLQPFLQLRHVSVFDGAHVLGLVRCSAVRSRQRRNEARLTEHFVEREASFDLRHATQNGQDIGDVGNQAPAIVPDNLLRWQERRECASRLFGPLGRLPVIAGVAAAVALLAYGRRALRRLGTLDRNQRFGMRRDFHDASHNSRASFASLPKRDLSLNVSRPAAPHRSRHSRTSSSASGSQ